jgi:predicted O-linked N-acetylglucosamine transferase (SPINDLY family)
VPGAKLLLHAAEGSHRQRSAELLQRLGINPRRLRFVGKVPLSEYLNLYGQIDIALDPFPYGGGITTCHALWMGVPVVSLRGETAVGRAGLSLLSNIGLPDLVAHTKGEYVQLATALANDLPRLLHLRSTLRERMAASPLMNAPRFARDIEAAYREMWRRWCAEKS